MFTSHAPRHSAARQPRRVANLMFSEIIIVWALRHCLAAKSSSKGKEARIAPEFSRALGLARLEESLAALASLSHCLTWAARLPQKAPAVDDDRVTSGEEAVLAMLGAFQHGDPAQATRLGEWLVRRSAQGRLAAAARRLAAIMAEAGQFIPPGPSHQMPRNPLIEIRLGGDQTIAGDDALRSAADWQDLTASEQHLVRGLRLWVDAFKKNEDALQAARAHFAAPTAADSALSLNAVLRNTTLAALRPIDVRCRNCPGLSPDEARLLDCIAWLQREAMEPAAAALESWLPSAALRLSLDAARGLATGMMLDGQILPLRNWDYAALEAAAHPPAPGQGSSKTADPEINERHGQTGLQAAASPTLH